MGSRLFFVWAVKAGTQTEYRTQNGRRCNLEGYVFRAYEYSHYGDLTSVLTRITEPKAIAVAHFLDSLAVFRVTQIPTNARVLDVGTGAGLPGLALKIARPDITLTLLDSTAKKLLFCRTVADDLGLTDVVTLHERAEEAGRDPKHAAAYDLVTARAVAPLERLLPWCAPFLHPNGVLVALKGASAPEELESAKPIAKKLGLRLDKAVAIPLPEADEPTVRQIIVGRRR